MKSIIKYIGCLFIGLSVFSCSDYLDVVPDNVPSIESVYVNRYTTEQALATCYWSMPRMGAYNENLAWLGALEMTFPTARQTEGAMRYALGYANAASPQVNYWSGTSDWSKSLYFGIRECNTFLENVENVPDLKRAEKDRMIAEVKLLKAYQHFYMILYYGPMCPQKKSTPVSEATEAVQVYREKIDDCFTYTLELIDEAIAGKALPARIINRTTELGRLTEAAAYMLKAKVLMFWASPLFNGNTDYHDFLDHTGEPFFNQTYDAARWTKAAEACKEAMEVCTKNSIHLYRKSDFDPDAPATSDSTLLVNTLRSSVTERWNVELIWSNTAYPINPGSGIQADALPRMQAGTLTGNTGRFGVPFTTVDLFYSKNGVPIEEDPSYDYNGRFGIRTGDEAHKYYIQTGEQTGAMNFDREPRFYSTLGFDRGKWYGNHYANPEDDEFAIYLMARYGEYSSAEQNISDGNYNPTSYWPKKIVSLNTTYRSANEWTNYTYPYPDMRFAELLLFYAEALNESKAAPDGEVYQYIDMVRERAGLEGVVESWAKYSNNPAKPATQAGMREIIQRERKIEFACEAKYFWDTRRWKTATKELNRLIQGWNVLEKDVNAFYTPVTLYSQRFELRNYFCPIPEGDILKNPNLVQNPGY
ncbi:starch-binding protein [Bacteroidia bacterium]|nr:starch-binding protein [Bacteroidia bacterium]